MPDIPSRGSGFHPVRWADAYAARFYRELGMRVSSRYIKYLSLEHPLLQRLSREIPGTFLHSVLVGFAAAVAAHAIGADVDLTRIGGYYHDGSKLKNPQFFMEAVSGTRKRYQPVSDPRHLDAVLGHPRESARILRSYNFPEKVCKLVAQHHGTRITRLELAGEIKEAVLAEGKERLRYPGPRPASREAAILMLADSAEAYFHGVMRDKTAPRLDKIEQFEEGIRHIGRQLREGEVEGERRVEEPQFNQSGLTREEQAIVEAKIAEALFRFYQDLDVIHSPRDGNGDPVFLKHLPAVRKR